MTTITQAAKILNIERRTLQYIIKNENLQLDKSEGLLKIIEHQLSYLIEKHKIEYIYLESKMNEPELLNQ